MEQSKGMNCFRYGIGQLSITTWDSISPKMVSRQGCNVVDNVVEMPRMGGPGRLGQIGRR
jgi:hypothetical protein